MANVNPRLASLSLTSRSDLSPKFGSVKRSTGDFWTSSWTNLMVQRVLGQETARWEHSRERPRGVWASAGDRVAPGYHSGRSCYPHAPAPPVALAVFRLRGGLRLMLRRDIVCKVYPHKPFCLPLLINSVAKVRESH